MKNMKTSSQSNLRTSIYLVKPLRDSASPLVEILEARQLLSGSVVASVNAYGDLIVRGDAADNVITLDQEGLSANQVRVSGSDGTLINDGAAPVVLTGITNRVSVRLVGGRDRLFMNNISLPGNVLLEQRRGILGNVEIAGDLRVLSRAATSLINTAVGGNLTTESTSVAGAGTVVLAGATVQGTTTISGGVGADVVTIDDSTFNDFGVFTGAGDDSVRIEASGDPLGVPTEFGRPATILLGSGNDVLKVGLAGQSGNRAVFAKRVLFDGKAGFDTLLKADNTEFVWQDRVQIINFEANTLGQLPINLGAAAPFAVMATASISSTGTTVVNGDVGLNPGSSQGVPPAQVNGTIHVNDPATVAARADLLAAYNDAVSRTVNAQVLPGNLGGLTLTPGVYVNSSSVMIQGSGPGNNLTLDAQGDPNAVFIFKMGSTLTTGPGAQVILAGGARASNIFWQVGTSATLGTTTIFKGSILAAVTITVDTGSVVRGRLLAGSNSDGSVTINASTISLPL